MSFLRKISGIFLIGLGIVGLVLPILQGWPLIFLGLYLVEPVMAERLKRRMLRKFSKKETLCFDQSKKISSRAAVTTRHFGVFFKKTDDLCDGEAQKRLADSLSRDKTLLSHGWTSFDHYVFLNQVHGDRVVSIEEMPTESFHRVVSADSVITNLRGLNLIVMTADCLSVYFTAGDWIGLVHAGWRGTKEMIGPKTARFLMEKSGVPLTDVQVLFGPAISKKNYEVGKEFENFFPKTVKQGKNGRFYFDLSGENKRQLLELGIPEQNIRNSGICPYDENEDFFSFRKEKEEAGRMLSLLVRK